MLASLEDEVLCILVDSATVICWTSLFVNKGYRVFLSLLFYFLWKILFANNADPDQTPHYVASNLGQHRMPMTFLRVCM